jgi:hypothetical protein
MIHELKNDKPPLPGRERVGERVIIRRSPSITSNQERGEFSRIFYE